MPQESIDFSVLAAEPQTSTGLNQKDIACLLYSSIQRGGLVPLYENLHRITLTDQDSFPFCFVSTQFCLLRQVWLPLLSSFSFRELSQSLLDLFQGIFPQRVGSIAIYRWAKALNSRSLSISAYSSQVFLFENQSELLPFPFRIRRLGSRRAITNRLLNPQKIEIHDRTSGSRFTRS